MLYELRKHQPPLEPEIATRLEAGIKMKILTISKELALLKAQVILGQKTGRTPSAGEKREPKQIAEARASRAICRTIESSCEKIKKQLSHKDRNNKSVAKYLSAEEQIVTEALNKYLERYVKIKSTSSGEYVPKISIASNSFYAYYSLDDGLTPKNVRKTILDQMIEKLQKMF